MSDSRAHFTIGVLSKRAGGNIETIYYYERIDLLPVLLRTQGGYRRYRLEHLKRLNFIRRARELGFTLDQVRALLDLADDHSRFCGEARNIAKMHLNDVRTRIAALSTMERVVEDMIARCEDGTLSHCPLIEALFDVSGR